MAKPRPVYLTIQEGVVYTDPIPTLLELIVELQQRVSNLATEVELLKQNVWIHR